MGNDSPAFQFYPGDFLSDRNTMVMTAEEIGAYWLLISHCWKDESLPDDMEHLAALSRMDFEKFQKAWEKKISRCFCKKGKVWKHPRLEKEKSKQLERRKSRSEAGKKGADSRWQTHGNAIAKPKQSHANGMANDGSSSSSSSPSPDSNTPKSPQGGSGKKKRLNQGQKERLKSERPRTDTMLRIGQLFNRGPETKWTIQEVEALDEIEPTEEELALIEKFYSHKEQQLKNGFTNYWKGKLITLLNQWHSQVDVAKTFTPQKTKQDQNPDLNRNLGTYNEHADFDSNAGVTKI